MNLAMKWLTGALLTLALLVGIHDAAAAEPPTASATATADPATWGVYAQLPGTEWKTNGGVAEWQWGPDNSIVETRSFMMKTVIRPGANPGELVSVYGGGLHTYDGRIAADGTVLWIRRGRFLKMPSRVSIVDGELIEEMVKLDDANQVAKVGTIVRFEQTAGAKVAAIAAVAETATGGELVAQAAAQPGVVGAAPPVPVPAAVAPAAPAAAMPSVAALAPPAPAVSSAGLEQSPLLPLSRELFGPYAEVVGFSHITPEGYQIRWYQFSDSAVVHEFRAPTGEISDLQIIKTTGPGSLVMLRSGWCPDGVCGQAGTVADGVAHWKQPKASGGHSGGFMDTRVWVENGVVIFHSTDPAPESDLFERFPHLRPVPQRLALIPSPPLTAEQATESRNRVTQLEPLVELEVAKAISKQLATGQSIADAQAQRQRSAERVRSFNRLMGSVNGVLTEANEIATANEAQSRAELQATLAQINAQAEAQRQAQAEAQRRAQQQAAEEQRRQLAENARWVAQKEQAAAEYRAGQTQAAAAREAQLASQQREVEQRHAAAEVDRRNAAQTATVERQRTQAAALAERAQLTARPVTAAETNSSQSSGYQSSQGSATTPVASGPIEMFVFFVNLDGKTVAFEGPTAMTRAEGTAMQARLQSEAPGRYGAGAIVDARSRGGGWCAFVYQRPGEAHYIMGSETSFATATSSMKGQVNNVKAVIHHDVVCPTNH